MSFPSIRETTPPRRNPSKRTTCATVPSCLAEMLLRPAVCREGVRREREGKREGEREREREREGERKREGERMREESDVC